ncbi:2-keto-4-pentenoate hydratase [Azospirillum sp. ST 5-10]|uniref:2-keto-4-pentenoate hydratase n=1 Tax=unclassified Azospirillum TaxID=2630922 RepID=UPI003F4A22FD
MDTASCIDLAADLLVAVRRGGARPADLPDDLRPASATDAYAIQDAVVARLGETVEGWKVGARAPDAEPNCAPLVASAVSEGPAVLNGNAFSMRGIEAEIAVRFGRALPPRAAAYGRHEVLDAVDALMPALEVVDTRYAERTAASPLSQLADFQSNGHFVAGTPVTEWHGVDPLTQAVRLTVDGEERAAGRGGNPAGDPFALLVWLANTLSARGVGIDAGTIVTTGTMTGLVPVGPSAHVVAEMPGLGRVELRFEER